MNRARALGETSSRKRALPTRRPVCLLLAGGRRAPLFSSSAAVELTPENFDKEVFQSGKAAFIKFLAPW